jgi:alpha-tubulin suppressor-like RCC1 family protein
VRVLRGDRPGSVKYVDINCGEQFCTALGDDGVLYGWGLNLGDTLGRDTQTMRLATAPIRSRGPIR